MADKTICHSFDDDPESAIDCLDLNLLKPLMIKNPAIKPQMSNISRAIPKGDKNHGRFPKLVSSTVLAFGSCGVPSA
jgi:hypothetical protein